MQDKIDRFDPDYPYKKNFVTIDHQAREFPIIERTNNGLTFPEGPKDEVDMFQLKTID